MTGPRPPVNRTQLRWLQAAKDRLRVQVSDGREGRLIGYNRYSDRCKVLIGTQHLVWPRSDVIVLDPEHHEKGTPDGKEITERHPR